MILNKLSLINYKNIASKDFQLDAKINCFTGNNGVGKTTVLDSVYYLAFGKSYFNPIASQNIKHGEDFFVVDGTFSKNNTEERILCSLKKGQKKTIKRNGKVYEKLSDHVGLIPLVIISPADRDLITEGSETRRKFIDNVISQSNKTYLQQLINYNKVLQQRNALLKYFALNSTFDSKTLEVYNDQLSEMGSFIHSKRIAFLEEFIPIFKERYYTISGNQENINLVYESQLNTTALKDLFTDNLSKDRALQYTSVGIHKDDLSFEIDDHSIKKFGSQGQQKTFLIALKLAQFDFIKNQSQVKPILLLDDIFDKLDENRVTHIVQLVNEDTFGQIFISDTHSQRTEDVVKKTNQTYKIFNL
ncbi:DNA replication and repair protein RecF [Pustulibacterium marinum]|uniref:DNA replication and repair protein RecF n=1 Tax=Pustulibacterium marinum TaxID=1224947 RepID=A0A1I7H5M6_9FLAO|nr:DNA replication and repair protein RecF [Pustulibacterium marinum]SFU55972.1 DNA replication and repair protein RecF [Pustulibacterium marinum]